MAGKSCGKLVNLVELSQILGKSLPTISSLVKHQMPFVKKGGMGREWQFDTAVVIRWLADRQMAEAEKNSASQFELEKQLLKVELDHKRLKYARDAGEVAPLSEMERRLSNLFAEIRANLRNIPARIASTVVGETDEKQVKIALLKEIDEALTALSKLDINELGAEEHGIDEPE